jgi:hypothetical protein
VPTALAAVAGELSLAVSWDGVGDADLMGYEVSLSRYPGDYVIEATVDDQTTEATFEGLEAGKLYYISVRSFDQSGNRSEWADEISEAPDPAAGDDDDDDNDDNDTTDDDDTDDDNDDDDDDDDNQQADDGDDDDDDDGCCG